MFNNRFHYNNLLLFNNRFQYNNLLMFNNSLQYNNRLLESMAADLELNSFNLRHQLQALAPPTKTNSTMLSLQLHQFAHNFIIIMAKEAETTAATLLEATVSTILNGRLLDQEVQALAAVASHLVLRLDLVDLAL